MPTQPCPEYAPNANKIAQTLFLGASVAGFNVSMGWDGQPSQLTVSLIDDGPSPGCYGSDPTNRMALRRPTFAPYEQYTPNPLSSSEPGHWDTCVGYACFIDKKTNQVANAARTNPQDLVPPGKVYYILNSNGLKSKYFTKTDPGFFGDRTSIDPKGTETNSRDWTYDIIDTPVIFKMNNFVFAGFVQSWSRNIDNGGQGFTVVVNGAQSILNSCSLILDKFGGTIFSRSSQNALYGSPKNYIAATTSSNRPIDYTGSDLTKGSIPNLFNIYGFLESHGIHNFGVAKNNERGLSANKILDALSLLTGITENSKTKLGTVIRPQHASKIAFSTFGRIISKCMQVEDSKSSNELFTPIARSFDSFGVIPRTDFSHLGIGQYGDRCQFILDIYDVIYHSNGSRRFPDSFYINEPVTTIGNLLSTLAEAGGFDFFTELLPVINNGKLVNIIKIKVISRFKQPSTRIIEGTIDQMICNGYDISSVTHGKEKNESTARSFIVGGNQQRLLQIKSYRLAYSQSNFIYNPASKQFVNYYSLNSNTGGTPVDTPGSPILTNPYGYGKIKFPNFGSTRNSFLYTNCPGGDCTALTEETMINRVFETPDTAWEDTVETKSGKRNIPAGNYDPSFKLNHAAFFRPNGRWIPLYKDNICPFFGYTQEENASIQTNSDNSTNNVQRLIRPVWYDAWTGQLAVVIRVNELPKINVGLNRLFLDANPQTGWTLPYTYSPTLIGTNLTLWGAQNPNAIEYFILTESEMRAALAGFDNYLAYSLAKTYKPDLIEMVRRAYFIKTRNTLVAAGMSLVDAVKAADQETNWYWKLMDINVGGDLLYPTVAHPDKNDGSQYIQEQALQDLQILHKFITSVAKYYGKKYMVKAPYLNGYRDEDFAATSFKTAAGYGYIFSGDGSLKYNYVPTNDGAWEEYGNLIDDCIPVGSPQWYQLTDDVGKIKPLLGYNSSPVYDYIREAKCKAAASQTFASFKNWELHPYFDYQSWLMVYESKTTNCGMGINFVFPSVDLSTLEPSEFVTVDQIDDSSQLSLLQAVAPDYFGGTNKLPAYDAFGKDITAANPLLGKTKTYVIASVEENYGFLGATNGTLTDPRILIEGPGVNLTSTNQESSKDVNRTVLSNCAIEDVVTYLYVTAPGARDWAWLASMMNYACPIIIDDINNPYVLGLYTVSSNSSANNVELAPKAAHPFFAAIPIKSNQYVYGPWTNYPHQKRNDIFSQFSATFGDCTGPIAYTNTIRAPNLEEANNAINNFITDLNVDINDDYVPWNYGGSQALDFVVAKDIESKTSYQSVIETAQLDMVGLPIFNLAGAFNGNNINRFNYTAVAYDLTYVDAKAIFIDPAADGSFAGINNPTFGQTPSLGLSNVTTLSSVYSLITLKNTEYDGPYISNMQASITDQGIKTTYNFRTYTRKVGLFNREFTERLKKLNLANLQRNKQINNLQKSISNISLKQDRFLLEQNLNKAQFGSSDLASKLFGWSPGTVLIGQAHSYIEEPDRTPVYIEDYSKYTSPGAIASNSNATVAWSVDSGDDQGDNVTVKPANRLTDKLSPEFLRSTGRIVSTVQLYERKEVEAQINKQYGSQSAMSLDGLLSPVSFFPTPKNGTFAFSKYNIGQCPFCAGAGVRSLKLALYSNSGKSYVIQNFVCEHCAHPGKKLNAQLPSDNEDTEANVPITCITYNPIIVPYGEFKNPNHQNYTGSNPDPDIHGDISSASPGYAGVTRPFQDRLRHCIEIVGRGSIPPSKMKYQLETSKNLTAYNAGNADLPEVNLDYYGDDIALYNRRLKINDPQNMLYETNQRFMGLRGPLVLHSWGYDIDGYPAPNAADEPYAIDQFGRPMRFQLIVKNEPAKPYKDIPYGTSFTLAGGGPIFSKTVNNEFLPASVTDATSVTPVEIKDNLEVAGGFDPGAGATAGNPSTSLVVGFKGSIISKTQKFEGGKWTEKKRLKQFYLNWGERPDTWKVGPVDLRWDEKRRVWTFLGGGAEEIDPPYIITNSNDIITLDEFIAKKTKKKYIYRMTYVTLEEDLIKQPDFDETYVTRGFIDDIEFSTEPLALGFRRLVYLKDKTGYCAPKGTKLLCRYNGKTGFYEPVSKPVITTTGKIISSNQVLLNLLYTPSRRGNIAPTSTVNYVNPLGFATPINEIGIFSFIDSQWTLTSIKP